MKNFIIPKIKSKEPVSAIYKMSFAGDYFYIGSSSNIKHRMWNWKYKLNSGVKKNYLVSAAFENSTTVTFEIIEFVDKSSDARIREDFYLKKFWGDKKLLNRTDSAFGNVGIKWTKEQIIKKPIVKSSSKKVAKFDKGGCLINIYDSRLDAAIDIGVDPSRIRKCLKKYGHSVNGFIYKDVDDNGGFIEAPIIPRKKGGRKVGSKLPQQTIDKMRKTQQKKVAMGDYLQPTHSKKMIKYDMSGSILAEFPSIGAAAKSMEADVKNFKKSLKKGRPGYYKGFIWKVSLE